MKRALAFFLALIMLLSLCACGESESRDFRTLRVIDKRSYCVMCRGGDKLAPVVDAALSVLAANGTLASISWAWLNTNLVVLEGSASALDPYTQALEPRRLIVGVDRRFNPLSYEENGQMQGLFVDVAKAIGELLGWEVVLQPMARNELAAQLSSGNIDCAVGFDSRLVSAEKYSVSEPFLKSEIVLAVRGDSGIKRLGDLDGRRIGVVEDAALEKMLKGDEKIAKCSSGPTSYVSARQCIKALDMGWCGAVAMDSLMLAHYAAN